MTKINNLQNSVWVVSTVLKLLEIITLKMSKTFSCMTLDVLIDRVVSVGKDGCTSNLQSVPLTFNVYC